MRHHPAVLALAAVAFALPAAGVAFAGSRDETDETVSRHGDLRLFLTGTCGFADEGRQAVLEAEYP